MRSYYSNARRSQREKSYELKEELRDVDESVGPYNWIMRDKIKARYEKPMGLVVSKDGNRGCFITPNRKGLLTRISDD